MTDAVLTDAQSPAHAHEDQNDELLATKHADLALVPSQQPLYGSQVYEDVFIPAVGSFMHPVARPGHIAYTLLVIDPAEMGQPPIIGSSYMKVAFPDLNLPDQFNLLPLAEQERIWEKLNEIILVRNESVVPIEAKGLCFVSQEWLLQHYPQMFQPQENVENGPGRAQMSAESSHGVTIEP